MFYWWEPVPWSPLHAGKCGSRLGSHLPVTVPRYRRSSSHLFFDGIANVCYRFNVRKPVSRNHYIKRLKENHHRMISKEVKKTPIYDRSLKKNRNRWYRNQLLLGYTAVTNNRQCQCLMTTKVDILFMLRAGCKLVVSAVCILHSQSQPGGAALSGMWWSISRRNEQ